MKLYIISLAVGILAGVLYGVLNVRSPAPPVAALIGLLGMLIGEQLVPIAKQYFSVVSFETSETATVDRTVSDSAYDKSTTSELKKTDEY